MATHFVGNRTTPEDAFSATPHRSEKVTTSSSQSVNFQRGRFGQHFVGNLGGRGANSMLGSGAVQHQRFSSCFIVVGHSVCQKSDQVYILRSCLPAESVVFVSDQWCSHRRRLAVCRSGCSLAQVCALRCDISASSVGVLLVEPLSVAALFEGVCASSPLNFGRAWTCQLARP